MTVANLFNQLEFFQGLSTESRKRIARICTSRKLGKKAMLFSEGEKGDAVYMLVSGAVGLIKTAPDGREVVIKVVQPGELFAEVILFEQDSYPVSAVAMAPSVVYGLSRGRFHQLLESPDFRADFISMLMRKQRYLAERIRQLTVHDVEDRFFMFLREHFGESNRIVPNLSNKDIAAAIGTTPETYSRLLARLSEEGKISVQGKELVLHRDVKHR